MLKLKTRSFYFFIKHFCLGMSIHWIIFNSLLKMFILIPGVSLSRNILCTLYFMKVQCFLFWKPCSLDCWIQFSSQQENGRLGVGTWVLRLYWFYKLKNDPVFLFFLPRNPIFCLSGPKWYHTKAIKWECLA